MALDKGINSKSQLSDLFSFSIMWNSIEAFGYQTVFLLYQVALFNWISPILFGLQGAFFATCYLAISLLNGAFDGGVIPVFSELSKTRSTFEKILWPFFFQSLILFITPLVLGGLFSFFPLLFPIEYLSYCSLKYLLLFSLFVGFEGTKKNLRSLLHLSFKNKYLAKLEVFNIASYATCSLLIYYSNGVSNLFILVFPFILISFFTTCLLGSQLAKFYISLPKGLFFNDSKIHSRFIKSRFYTYVNQITRILFSSNFLLPFLALSAGLPAVGIISLINTITFTCTCLIQKIFGPLGAALFAHTKSFPLKEKQATFVRVANATWIVSSIFFVLFLFYGVIFLKNPTTFFSSFSVEVLIYLFFLVHLVESCFIVYEKFFIAEEKQEYLLVFNVISGVVSFAIIASMSSYTVTTKLGICLITRLVSFGFLATSFYKIFNFDSTKK